LTTRKNITRQIKASICLLSKKWLKIENVIPYYRSREWYFQFHYFIKSITPVKHTTGICRNTFCAKYRSICLNSIRQYTSLLTAITKNFKCLITSIYVLLFLNYALNYPFGYLKNTNSHWIVHRILIIRLFSISAWWMISVLIGSYDSRSTAFNSNMVHEKKSFQQFKCTYDYYVWIFFVLIEKKNVLHFIPNSCC